MHAIQPLTLSTPSGTPLTNAKWEAFAVAFAESNNAAKAYARIYPDASPETARVNGHRWSKRPDIVQRVLELRVARYVESIGETQDLDALASAIATARADVRCDEHGRILPVHEQPRHVQLAIDGVDYEDGQIRKLHFAPITPLLNLLAKLRGQIVERHAHLVAQTSRASDVDLDVLVEAAKRRLGIRTDADVVDGEVVESAEREPPKLEELV